MQQRFNRSQQLVHVEGLAQEAVRSLGVCDLLVSQIVVRSDDHNSRPVSVPADMFEHAEPAAAGHHDVQYDQIGRLTFGLHQALVSIFGDEELMPAPAQGALACECRADDAATLELLHAIDQPNLRAAVAAERAFLARLEAGCSFPAAAYAEIFGSTIKVNGMIAPDGDIVRTKVGGPIDMAAGLGQMLADELLQLAGMRA